MIVFKFQFLPNSLKYTINGLTECLWGWRRKKEIQENERETVCGTRAVAKCPKRKIEKSMLQNNYISDRSLIEEYTKVFNLHTKKFEEK